MSTLGTKDRALREATALLQEYGFEGFSFQHVADLVGIKKPSLYDHFKSKEELGIEIIKSNHERFAQWTQIIRVFEPEDQIGAFFEMFFDFSSQSKKYCPLSAAISDLNSIPSGMRKPLEKMYLFELNWLEEIVLDGQKKRAFRKDRTYQELAAVVFSIALGAQVIARVTKDPSHIRRMKEQALMILT